MRRHIQALEAHKNQAMLGKCPQPKNGKQRKFWCTYVRKNTFSGLGGARTSLPTHFQHQHRCLVEDGTALTGGMQETQLQQRKQAENSGPNRQAGDPCKALQATGKHKSSLSQGRARTEQRQDAASVLKGSLWLPYG